VGIRKLKKIKAINIVLTVLVISLVTLTLTTYMLIKGVMRSLSTDSDIKEIEIVDAMKDYDYVLTETDTELFKKLFYELKDLLEKTNKSTDFEEKYAKLVAQLFVVDFYDLDSKINKNDVGGVQFVYESYRESFRSYASDITGIYYYIENNTYGDREQKLPIVEDVEITSITVIAFEHEEFKDDNAFLIAISIKYKEDLGYDKTVELVLAHNNKKIEVVEMR